MGDYPGLDLRATVPSHGIQSLREWAIMSKITKRAPKPYWCQVHRRALKEARIVLRIDTGERAVITGLLAAIYLVLVWTLVGKEAGSSEFVLKVAASLAPVVLLPIIYIFKFFLVPPSMHQEALNESASLRIQLNQITTKRPFLYKTFSLVGGPHPDDGHKFSFTPTLIFENRGDEIIRFELDRVSVSINECCAPEGSQINKGMIVRPHDEAQYTLPTIRNISIPGFPAFIDIEFVASYDNLVPASRRVSERKIKYQISSFNPMVFHNFVLKEDER
jgi:hypothetical protein